MKKMILCLAVMMLGIVGAVALKATTKKCTKSLLLLVDVQYDFINGSLAVDGAPLIMDNLANYIAEQPEGTFDNIVMTADFHPYDHSSFKDNGGKIGRAHV